MPREFKNRPCLLLIPVPGLCFIPSLSGAKKPWTNQVKVDAQSSSSTGVLWLLEPPAHTRLCYPPSLSNAKRGRGSLSRIFRCPICCLVCELAVEAPCDHLPGLGLMAFQVCSFLLGNEVPIMASEAAARC
uniref:Uncharacterized protein n=1 Tax=Photinus pyralis TaxID=7054 RepID=A0A1Y1KEP3_PHOPY